MIVCFVLVKELFANEQSYVH